MIRFAWLCLALFACACSYERSKHPDACDSDDACPSGRSCYEGFCIVDASNATNAEGAACVSGSAPLPCYEGAAATEGKGICRAGQRFCSGGVMTKCFDQVKPSAESCNEQDDDCNDMVDDIADESCDVAMGDACVKAGTRVCRSGVSSCELAATALDEVCNGQDDDCDQRVDEVTSTPCFPVGALGCKASSNGTLQCKGVCVPGTSRCTSGALACEGAVVAGNERCDDADDIGYDDDCDGKIDEGCPCLSVAARSCYAGPKGSEGEGACELGSQRCSNGKWAACGGQGLPTPETCNNQGNDDDCNGKDDDILGLGQPCIDITKQGECRSGTLQCVSSAAVPVCVGKLPSAEQCDSVDQDCDGDPFNGFDLGSDQTCGACDVSCAGVQSCCGGTCKTQADLDVDTDNCGACGNACGSNRYCCQGECLATSLLGDAASCECKADCGDKACCGTNCVDLDNDANNCGACGRRCGKGMGPGMVGGKCKAGVCG